MKHRIIFALSLLLFVAGAVGLIISISNAKFSLDDTDYGKTEFTTLTGEEYEEKIKSKDSFLLFVDQDGCITAVGLRAILEDIMAEKNLSIYRVMYADIRNGSLGRSVKHFPSVVMISGGKVKNWLKADADEDTERYKNKDELTSWLDNSIEWKN